jgi:hypothetical protein
MCLQLDSAPPTFGRQQNICFASMLPLWMLLDWPWKTTGLVSHPMPSSSKYRLYEWACQEREQIC